MHVRIEIDEPHHLSGIIRLDDQMSRTPALVELGNEWRAAVERPLGIERREIAASRLDLHFEVAQRDVGTPDDIVYCNRDVRGLAGVRVALAIRAVADVEQRAEEIAAVEIRAFDIDGPSRVVAALAIDGKARHDIEVQARKIKLLELVVGPHDDPALGGDVVAHHLEILQFGIAALAADDLGRDAGVAPRGLAPLQLIECDLGIGQIGVQRDRGLGPVAFLQRNLDWHDAVHDVVDVEAELRAVSLVKPRHDLHRRLIARVGAEDTLPDDLRGNAVDEQIALRIE